MKLSIAAPGAIVSTSGTSGAVALPVNQAQKTPDFVRVAATAAAYVRLGTGGGAAGTAYLGAISAAVGTAGSGYAVGDTITIAGGTSTSPAIFEVATETGGAIDTVTVVDPGDYSVIPANDVAQASSSGAGTGAELTVTWGVSSVVVTAGGSGYAATPAVTLTGGSGTGATATATLTDDAVTAVTVTAPGTGYATVPTVVFAESTTAVAGDTLVQPGDAIVLHSKGKNRIAAIQVSSGGVVQVSPVEDVFR